MKGKTQGGNDQNGENSAWEQRLVRNALKTQLERNKIFILLRSKRRSVYRMFAYQVSPANLFSP